MNIVLLRRKKGCTGLVTLCHRKLSVVLVGLLIIMPIALIYGGYRLGISHMRANPDALTREVQSELDVQRVKLSDATRKAEENLNALALRLGQLQAHVIRLDALGQRLTSMAKLDKGEFDFENPPAQGGPDSDAQSAPMEVPDFVAALNELSAQLDDRGRQLSVLETMLMNRNLQAEVMPAGRPVKHGWLSSYFGMRTDPFTGRRALHTGLDFAGKMGSDVVSVAAGVVTYAGKRSGYGNLVEINHGNGYSTRYGHNSKILVSVGQTVKKGQIIAKMGSTGRSTGPHVHFEVLINGHAVNPKKYIQASNGL
ncbi:MAG: peptidoglycan DD-metalloendopeptidase family protein [Gammaproteobacteria bacterium]|nr:peptidoglycan DD-metalloendopeptidase family protein [Gammaproteobacteria bacterium]